MDSCIANTFPLSMLIAKMLEFTELIQRKLIP